MMFVAVCHGNAADINQIKHPLNVLYFCSSFNQTQHESVCILSSKSGDMPDHTMAVLHQLTHGTETHTLQAQTGDRSIHIVVPSCGCLHLINKKEREGKRTQRNLNQCALTGEMEVRMRNGEKNGGK